MNPASMGGVPPMLVTIDWNNSALHLMIEQIASVSNGLVFRLKFVLAFILIFAFVLIGVGISVIG